MKRALLVVIVIGVILGAGCCGPMQMNVPPGAKMGKDLYNVNGLSQWTYNVTMSSGGVNSSWDMNVTNGFDGDLRHMIVHTLGNGMNIVYNVWSNKTTFDIDRMHANGTIGDYLQDRDVSKLQIYTLPDVGLSYWFVPFTLAGNQSIRDPDGNAATVGVYSATDNKGFSVTYWKHLHVPVPLFIEMKDKNFRITMMLTGYK
jgi:hypothetical protein